MLIIYIQYAVKKLVMTSLIVNYDNYVNQSEEMWQIGNCSME